jgi:hypothetical protein
MFDDAINACPDHLWTAALWEDTDDARHGQFWCVASHCLLWLDMYLDGSMEGFVPPAPFLWRGLPDQPYTPDEIRNYLGHCRQKCHDVILGLTDEQAYQVCKFRWMEPTFLELQIYCMRHVQEHAAQLNLVLGQNGITGQDWVSKARDKVS